MKRNFLKISAISIIGIFVIAGYFLGSTRTSYALMAKPNNCGDKKDYRCYEFVNEKGCLSDPEPSAHPNCNEK